MTGLPSINAMMDIAALHRPSGAKIDTERTYTDVAARKAAEQFESLFISQMFQHMSSGLKTDGPFGGGHAESMYNSMLYEKYGDQMSKNGGIGIADQVYSQLMQQQEV